MAARIAMMAITTSSSIRVKPRRRIPSLLSRLRGHRRCPARTGSHFARGTGNPPAGPGRNPRARRAQDDETPPSAAKVILGSRFFGHPPSPAVGADGADGLLPALFLAA